MMTFTSLKFAVLVVTLFSLKATAASVKGSTSPSSPDPDPEFASNLAASVPLCGDFHDVYAATGLIMSRPQCVKSSLNTPNELIECSLEDDHKYLIGTGSFYPRKADHLLILQFTSKSDIPAGARINYVDGRKTKLFNIAPKSTCKIVEFGAVDYSIELWGV